MSGSTRELLDFAMIWCPYGGGSDEDILVTFGITPSTYFRRLLEHLADDTRLDLVTKRRLTAMCERRLGISGS